MSVNPYDVESQLVVDSPATSPNLTIRFRLPGGEVILPISIKSAETAALLGDRRNRRDGGFEIGACQVGNSQCSIIASLLDPPEVAEANQRSRSISALPKWRTKRVLAYINEHLSEAIMLEDLAKAAGLSRMYFAAQFRAAMGSKPHEFVLRKRTERAQQLLTETAESLVNVALSVGFQTQSHFSAVFKRFTGYTPGQWRAANRGNVEDGDALSPIAIERAPSKRNRADSASLAFA
jgi:AraC-like DNA-binding protein